MKSVFVVLLFLFSAGTSALVNSDQEARSYFRQLGAGRNDFIESADSLLVSSEEVTGLGSCCLSLPIRAKIEPQFIFCCPQSTDIDTLPTNGAIVVKAVTLPLAAVRIKNSLYIGCSLKAIANALLK